MEEKDNSEVSSQDGQEVAFEDQPLVAKGGNNNINVSPDKINYNIEIATNLNTLSQDDENEDDLNSNM